MLKTLTTGLVEIVAARYPSCICLAVGVVTRPVVPKSEAEAANAETNEMTAQLDLTNFKTRWTTLFSV